MLVVNSVGPGVVRYFTDGRHPGRWSSAADRLFGLAGPVGAEELRRLLQGRHPRGGTYLPETRPHRRRGGWDLIFGAPKSVSLLAAVAGQDATSVQDAHVSAVQGVIDLVDERLRLLRRGPDGTPFLAEGLIYAAFDHKLNTGNEPHLHTHLLAVNLGCARGVWGAIDSGDWFVGRTSLAALYQLELRSQLERQGWRLEWRLRPDGLADLADIPRAAVRAASAQGRDVSVIGWEAARSAASPQPWTRRVTEAAGAGGSRILAGDTSLRACEGRPGPERASGADGHRPGGGALADPALERAVSVRLTGRRSDFRAADVIVALAATHPGGASAQDAAQWADRFCAQNRTVRSPTRGRRWTTDAARRADDELAARLRGRLETRGNTSLAPSTHSMVAALTAGEAGTHFLGAPAGQTLLLSQAEVIAACVETWEGSGRRVAIATPTPMGAKRWEVLAGLTQHRPGDRPDVLVVDCADRRTTAELTRLAAGPAKMLVFVEGGTLPRLSNPASHGLMETADEAGRLFCPPHLAWSPAGQAVSPDGACGAERRLVGRAAAGALLARWYGESRPPLLVGLGLEEVRGLNRAVLDRRADRRVGDEQFLPGDRVVVLRGRPGLPVYGTFGTVVEGVGGGSVRRGRSAAPWARVAWDTGEVTETGDRRTLTGMGFGYAVTPWMANRSTGPLMVLGPWSALGRGRERVVAEVSLEGPARRRDRAVGL